MAHNNDSGNDDLALLVSWVRLGLCEKFLRDAVEYLKQRTIGGKSAFDLGPIRMDVGEANMALQLAQGLLEQEDTAQIATVDELINTTVDAIRCMFGAVSFLENSYSQLANTIDILGDMYCHVEVHA